MLKFFWNGIKDSEANNGKLQKASYSASQLINFPAGTITIYGKNFRQFSQGIGNAFTVKNDTDYQTDYFENDRIRVEPSHPLYSQVKAAYDAQEAHYDRIQERKAA